MTDTLEFLYKHFPQICWFVIIIIALVIISIAVITVRRYHKGEEISFWGIKVSKSQKLVEAEQRLRQLSEEFEIVSSNSRQKSILLKLFNEILKEVAKLLLINDRTNFNDRKDRIINSTLNLIISHLTKAKDNVHRVTLFEPDKSDKNKLKAYHHCGFISIDPEDLWLPLHGSAAGNVFLTGENYISPNVHKESIYYKHPKLKMDYSSLLCVPIQINGNCYGVLSLDGKIENSFDQEDLEYMKYFATLIGMVREMDYLFEDIKIYTK